MTQEEIQEVLPEIVAAMGEMDRRVAIAESTSNFKDMKPDIAYIEDFIYRAYSARYPKVTRLEVISEGGRDFVLYGTDNVEISLQDDERTMKIFLERKEK
jgi:hypothetical protein